VKKSIDYKAENVESRSRLKTNLKLVQLIQIFEKSSLKQKEGRAVTGNYHTMQGTCTESLHLILRQSTE